MKILSVDDSKTIRSALKSIVEVIGIEVLEAEDGLKALEVLKKEYKDIDLIILDWEMPNMNGIEFLKEAKGVEEYKSIPVIMLTTINQKERMIEAIRSGAKQYLTKPFTSEDLLTKIIQTVGPDKLEQL